MKTNFKTGDIVKILSGSSRGKTGKVLVIDRKAGRVIVEGVNLQTHFVKKSDKNPQGGMPKREGYIHMCKVAKTADGAQSPKVAKAPKAAKVEDTEAKKEKPAAKKSLSKKA